MVYSYINKTDNTIIAIMPAANTLQIKINLSYLFILAKGKPTYTYI